MSKRIKAMLVALVMVLGMLATAMPSYAANTNEVTIVPNKTEVHPGDVIEYRVIMGPIENLQGFQFGLEIPSGLTYVPNSGKVADGLLQTLGAAGGGFTEVSKMIVIYGGGSYDSTEDTLLMTFSCTVDEDADGYYDIGWRNVEFADDTYNVIDVELNRESSRVEVTPIPVPAQGISLDRQEMSLVAGTQGKLVATVTPDNSTDKVTWTTSNDQVATVSNDGTVSAVGVGTATVTATAGAYSATCQVNVTCAHEHMATVNEKDSTCVVQGWDTYQKCEDCGQLFDETGKEIGEVPFRDLAAHQGGTADCSHKAVCTVCGNEYGDFGDHNYGALVARVEATCEEEGMKAHYVCNICNTYFDEDKHETTEGALTIAALGHDLGDWESDGASHWKECTRCHEKMEVGTCTGGEATCVNKAVCEVCGHTYGDVNANNHKHTELRGAVEATCKDDGYTGDTYCTDCGKLVEAGEVIPATGAHASDKWVSGDGNHWQVCDTCGTKFNEGTCTGGEATCVDKAVCEVCGHAYGDVNANNHKHTELRGAVEATCKDDGYTGDIYCTDCGKLVEAGEVISATGVHASDEWLSEDGSHWQICDICGTKFNEGTCAGGEATCVDKAVCEVCGHAYGDVDPENHKHTVVKDAVEATCEKDGYTGDTYCADCGVLLEKGETVAATGVHTPSEEWKTDGTYRWQVCTDCGAVLNKELVQDSGENPDQEKPDQDKPETGDSANLMLWGSIMTAAVVVLVGVNVYAKKRYHRG